MRIQVKVKPSAKIERVEPQPDGSFLISVKAPPVEGKANDAVVRAVAEHFGVPRSQVRIARGTSGRLKSIEIDE